MVHLKEWFSLSDDTRRNIYTDTGNKIGLTPMAVEKDWWVVHALAVIFSMGCGGSLVFKGGTSLSKGWGLIERFSEDIDLALDREYLGYKGELTKADVRRLRKESYSYVTEVFTTELSERFKAIGFEEVSIKYREVVNHDQDPMIVEIYYPKLTEKDEYLKPGLLIEVGARSLMEPYSLRTISTFISQHQSDFSFVDEPINIPAVNPERTFLEKVFLLHEGLQQPTEKIRIERMSRHLYDVEMLSHTKHGTIALDNQELYYAIVDHRNKFNHISGIDYSKHNPQHIRIIPGDDILPEWETDYRQMQELMIYGDSLPFSDLIESLTSLQTRINAITWKQ